MVQKAFDEIVRELDRIDADAFVHVGDRFDDLLRYFTDFSGPDRDYAFVFVAGRAILCAPRLFGEQARREFGGDDVRTSEHQTGATAPARAIETIREFADAERILVPSHISHRTATALEQHLELVTTDADFGRSRKTPDERAALAEVQEVAQRGMARSESILAETTIRDECLHWKGKLLTTERLRREVNAVLARHGVQDARNTVIGAGPSCADLHFTGEDEIHSGETILLDISPRGSRGYYGDVTRTFVVGDIGEWERATYDAVQDAQDAALETLDSGAGIRAETVHRSVSETLQNHGFEVGDVSVGMYHGTGHGVGRSLHESPSLSSDERLEVGNVVTVEPGVYDPERGGVRIEDLVVVTESGYENLTDYPRRIRPSPSR
ncbi:M24 family metallopeptidase [Haladaptatus cibarius]|uniref:M24 family metallopeptidase n=1 Tax=Haladaptatus cibarius TaxID=453847 RepID=UPI000678FD86|nr:Xaa-Pro peptidase family protein [Haladaptatus cibarius]